MRDGHGQSFGSWPWQKNRCEHRWSEITSQYKVKIRQIFKTLPDISPKNCVLFHQQYAWLESYGPDASFGTKISGSFVVIWLLLLFYSRNTPSVTHSDTASYVTVTRHICNNGILKSFRIENIQKHISASFLKKLCVRDAKAVQYKLIYVFILYSLDLGAL